MRRVPFLSPTVENYNRAYCPTHAGDVSHCNRQAYYFCFTRLPPPTSVGGVRSLSTWPLPSTPHGNGAVQHHIYAGRGALHRVERFFSFIYIRLLRATWERSPAVPGSWLVAAGRHWQCGPAERLHPPHTCQWDVSYPSRPHPLMLAEGWLPQVSGAAASGAIFYLQQ